MGEPTEREKGTDTSTSTNRTSASLAQRKTSNRITIIGTAIGSSFGIVGAFIGALFLSSIWNGGSYFSFTFSDHPDLEVFGFLPMFVIATSYTIIPRFKNRNIPSALAGGISVGLFAAANAIWLFTSQSFIVYADALLVISSIIAFVLLALVLRRPSGPLRLAEPFFWLSSISLVIASILKIYFDSLSPNSGWNSFPFLEISLLGFPAMMIFGIEVRTIHFRIVHLKKKAVLASFCLSMAFVVLSTIAVLVRPFSEFSTLASSAFFALGSAALILALSALRENVQPEHVARMNERDRTRYFYYRNSTRIATYWLIIASSLGIIYSLGLFESNLEWAFWIRDGFIHSVAIGFLASSIAAYSPILLPSVLSSRAPYKGLSLVPLLIVTLGNVWRVGADLIDAFVGKTPVLFTQYSGILVVVGMLWFVLMNHRLK